MKTRIRIDVFGFWFSVLPFGEVYGMFGCWVKSGVVSYCGVFVFCKIYKKIKNKLNALN